MCGQPTGSQRGTRIYVWHCFVKGKAQHSCILQVKYNWRRILSYVLLLSSKSSQFSLSSKVCKAFGKIIMADSIILAVASDERQTKII